MPSIREISNQVEEFLAKNLSLEQLEDWSAEYSWNIHERADDGVQRFAYQIRSILDAHCDDSNEDRVRRALEDVVRPFVLGPVYAPAQTFAFELGNPQEEVVFGTSTGRLISWAAAA